MKVNAQQVSGNIEWEVFDAADLALLRGKGHRPASHCGRWHPERSSDGQHPKNFRDRQSKTLEAVLPGDGVAPADLYPSDVECAFAALDGISPR